MPTGLRHGQEELVVLPGKLSPIGTPNTALNVDVVFAKIYSFSRKSYSYFCI